MSIDYPGLFHNEAISCYNNSKNIVDFLGTYTLLFCILYHIGIFFIMIVEMSGVPSPKVYLNMSKTRQPKEFLQGINIASCSAGILNSSHELSRVSC